jgi:hypothetical protein
MPDPQEVDRSSEALEARRQKLESVLYEDQVQPTPPAFQAPARTIGGPECPECHHGLTRTGKNRLSDCGHMRWTQKGWQAKWEKPQKSPDTVLTEPGYLTQSQRQTIADLMNEYHAKWINHAVAFKDREAAELNLQAYLDEITTP